VETGLVERAYQLAPECSTLEELRVKLRDAGYANVDSYLRDGSLRKELTKLLRHGAGKRPV
jgi:hypothetical protein